MPSASASRTTTAAENAQHLLCTRYLVRYKDAPQCGDCDERHETLDEFYTRVSLGNPKYEELMRERRFLPNSPTLFNVGTGMGTLSACFKFDVEDTMVSIMGVAEKAAMVQKWGGGVGYCLSQLRPKGAPIATTHRKACGPLAVIKHYDSVADLVTQGGKRQGAQMAILDCRHPDIRDFIQAKSNDPKTLLNFNLSVAVDDAFMTSAENGEEPEHEIWELLVQAAWQIGCPGVYFIDAAERANPTPWLGMLTGTNPCGEIPLLNNEACNLGSLNVAMYVLPDRSGFDYPRLQWDTRHAISFLDDVLDQNGFPNPVIAEATLLTRKLGLGVMGWADALALMSIDYESDEAVNLADTLMATITTHAHARSRELAEEKGPYPGWEQGAEWRREHGQEHNPLYERRRNASVTGIAPTGTISILSQCSSGVEPHFADTWVRTNGDGHQMEESIHVSDQLGTFQPKTSMQIDKKWHVLHQAAFQAHTDQAVSKTINLPNAATVEDVSVAYMNMWRGGCKGGTIYRDGCRTQQVLVDTAGEAFAGKPEAARRRLPTTRHSLTHKFMVGGQEGYLHAGLYDDDSLGEIFLNISKQGSTIGGLADMLSIFMSIGLQSGVPLEAYLKKMRQSRFEPAGLTGNPEIPTATSFMDYVGRWLELQFMGEEGTQKSISTGITCPDCGEGTIATEGCIHCAACAWSRC